MRPWNTKFEHFSYIWEAGNYKTLIVHIFLYFATYYAAMEPQNIQWACIWYFLYTTQERKNEYIILYLFRPSLFIQAT